MKTYFRRLMMAITVLALVPPVWSQDDPWNVDIGGRVTTAQSAAEIAAQSTAQSAALGSDELVEAPDRPQDDIDGDGVADDVDACNDSAVGFPVRRNGCALLSGVLTGVNFNYGTTELLPESFEQLFYLATILNKHPVAKIHIFSHSDNTGTLQQQAKLTRGRLRAIGTYLQKQGVSSSRLVLRSMAGSTPIYDNSSPEGRSGNNRIELLERR